MCSEKKHFWKLFVCKNEFAFFGKILYDCTKIGIKIL